LVDSCPVCGRPDIEVRISGSFELELAESNPLFSRWRLVNVQFTDGSTPPGYAVTGEGSFEIGGEVAVVQQGSLDVQVETPTGQRRALLTSPRGPAERLWPMWKASFIEDEGTLTSEIHLTLATAPVRELWFNTLNGMTPGLEGWPGGRISPADILTDGGRRVLEGQSLLLAAGVPGAEAEATDIDAFDVEPAHPGRTLISPDRDVRSDSLGVIREGDLVAVNGTAIVVRRQEELLRAFQLMPPVPDLGLDAVSVQPAGEIWFSLRSPGFSKASGQHLPATCFGCGPGNPVKQEWWGVSRQSRARRIVGWMDSTCGQRRFGSASSRASGPGARRDHGRRLAQRPGYVVAEPGFGSRFPAIEDLANFGLQGLFIVSDTSEPPAKRHN
jgi:hypothetical protein